MKEPIVRLVPTKVERLRSSNFVFSVKSNAWFVVNLRILSIFTVEVGLIKNLPKTCASTLTFLEPGAGTVAVLEDQMSLAIALEPVENVLVTPELSKSSNYRPEPPRVHVPKETEFRVVGRLKVVVAVLVRVRSLKYEPLFGNVPNLEASLFLSILHK